jgi:hypothetical protein
MSALALASDGDARTATSRQATWVVARWTTGMSWAALFTYTDLLVIAVGPILSLIRSVHDGFPAVPLPKFG